MTDLRKVPIEDLENELARRRKWRPQREDQPFPACDECANFRPYPGGPEDVPRNYNPCQQGHAMKFRMPDGPSDNEWGYYRLACADRRSAPATNTGKDHRG